MKSVRGTHQSFSKPTSALVLLALLIAAIAAPPRKVSAEDPGFQREFTIPDPGIVTETLVVSGVSTPITTMSLTITGFTSPRPDDLDMLLIAPDGTHNLEFMSDAGTTTATGPITFTLSDTGATAIPDAAL